MEFAVTLEKKEMEVVAWMLKTRTKTHIIEACKGIVLGFIVLGVELYNIFIYEDSTAAQIIILSILAAACIVKAVLSWRKRLNYRGIAEKKNKSIKGRTAHYTFHEEGVLCSVSGIEEFFDWTKFTEWGEYNGCVFIMFGGGIIIILDEEKYGQDAIWELKSLLMQKSAATSNTF